MRHRGAYIVLVGVVYILCGSVQPAFALVYTGVKDHTTAPETDPGWDSVGVMSIGSGAYLGDGWVIAPYHVYNHEPAGGRYVDLDQRYSEVPDTAKRIKYNDTIDADLIMFRIEGDPDLPMIEISSSSPLNEEVTIIASGRRRVGDLVDFGGGYEGYETEFSREKRWGRNETGGYVAAQSSTYGRTRTFATYFDSPGLGDDECQLVANDSGAAVFIESSSEASWELTGMALSVGIPFTYNGPSITQNAVYNAYTFYADMASYKSQIDAIRLIPLPGDADWDGDVDGNDIDIFRLTFGQRGADLQADFNSDGTVDLRDFAIIRSHLGMISGSGIPGATGLPVQVVPEPATLILMTGAIPLLLRSRRRK